MAKLSFSSSYLKVVELVQNSSNDVFIKTIIVYSAVSHIVFHLPEFCSNNQNSLFISYQAEF